MPYLGYPFGAGISLDKLEIRTNKDKVNFFEEKILKLFYAYIYKSPPPLFSKLLREKWIFGWN